MPQNSPSVVLQVQGIGHCPSFKNSKMIVRGKPITKPEYQRWMKACADSFMWQLLYSFPMSAYETPTAQQVRSWIASRVLEDDSCHFLTEFSCRCCKYPKGLEGAQVEIYQNE